MDEGFPIIVIINQLESEGIAIKPTSRFFFISSAVAYSSGIVHYTLYGKTVYPFIGGWIAGFLLMEGISRRGIDHKSTGIQG